MNSILESINTTVWGVPALVAILGVGLYLSIKTSFVQLRLFPRSFKFLIHRITNRESSDSSEVSAYQAFCTALGATVGTGNIAGVAGAIALGGPGAVFWMWVSALLGMTTKFAEATISVHFQERRNGNEIVAGPMYTIAKLINKRWKLLASVYCFFGVIAAFGVGNSVQINAVMGSFESVSRSLGWEFNSQLRIFIGTSLALLIAIVLHGGAKGIGKFAEKLVPFAALFYICLCVGVLLACWDRIFDALRMIVCGAFAPRAVTGGAIGSFLLTMRVGVSRGVFTNEAGLGTAGIAHGSAVVDHPVQQGMMGMMEVFLDTIVICTLTALVILCSGVSIPYGSDPSIALTTDGFTCVYGDWVSVPIAISLILFAIATIVGWGLYGTRCVQFLFGDRALKSYMVFQVVVAFVGAIMQAKTLWLWAETVNGLMMIPNLIALVVSGSVLQGLTGDYYQAIKRKRKSARSHQN